MDESQEARTYKVLGFHVPKVFPPNDPLAIHLLLLMAAYNDFVHLTEWIDNPWTEPRDEGETKISAGREFLQLRLMCSFLHEMIDVLNSLLRLPEFISLLEKGLLEDKGIQALERLKSMKKRPLVKNLFDRTRDKATFHYDKDKFQETLSRVIERYDAAKIVLVEHTAELSEISYYYPLPDHLRLRIGFGLDREDNPKPQLDEAMKAVEDLLGDFAVFLDHFHKAYIKDRRLEDAYMPVNEGESA